MSDYVNEDYKVYLRKELEKCNYKVYVVNTSHKVIMNDVTKKWFKVLHIAYNEEAEHNTECITMRPIHADAIGYLGNTKFGTMFYDKFGSVKDVVGLISIALFEDRNKLKFELL